MHNISINYGLVYVSYYIYRQRPEGKGNTFDLATLMKWGKDGVIRYKTITKGDSNYVNFVWC